MTSHAECVVPRPHALTSFIKARENKTTTLASLQQICPGFLSVYEYDIAVLTSKKDSKSTKGLYEDIFQEYLRHKNTTKRFKVN